MKDDKKRTFRSAGWFARTDKDGFIHRSWMRGYPQDVFDGRPVIGICNTWSELTPCNAHFRQLADHVKRGVWEMGGFPVEFPVMSSGETNLRPTAMLFRNLISMDVEESIRANPIDGVVLLTGCDKTVPALVMGAASVNLPAIVISGGAMLNGKFCGQDLGSGTDVWRFSEEMRAGRMSLDSFMEAQTGMSRSVGVCNVMGTASTMATMVEALGLSLPHNAAIPAPDSRRLTMCQLTGRRIVEMVHEDLTLSKILTRPAFENAIRVNGAVGGSTNAVIHLLAFAGRVGVDMTLQDWDAFGRDVPTLLDLKPSGRFLMEDFYYAGGLPAIIRALGEKGLLHKDALTVNGKSIWENCQNAPTYNAEVIRPFDKPLVESGGIAVLTGNLAPDGGVLKPSAASGAPPQAPRASRSVRDDRGLQRADRRSESRRRRDMRARAQELRPEGLPRHGRSRQHGPAAEGAREGRNRHGAHLGRPDERHGVRNRRSTRLSRSRGRRPARARKGRRHDRARRAGSSTDARRVRR